MTCTRVRMPNGGTAILCGRSRGKPRRCSFCSSASALLCDYVLLAGRVCSKPLCVRCAVRQDHNARSADSVDHCPDHALGQLELQL